VDGPLAAVSSSLDDLSHSLLTGVVALDSLCSLRACGAGGSRVVLIAAGAFVGELALGVVTPRATACVE
jgi:hypothetical protein